MAFLTRRSSGTGAAFDSGSADLLETIDAFRRKHTTQNKEIIHRNSDLMKANAELANKLRETQNELMASRAEAVQLHAHVLNLQVKIAWLKGQLRDTRSQLAATQRGSLASLPTDSLHQTLDLVIRELQGLRASCAQPGHRRARDYNPVSPPESPPASLPPLLSTSAPAGPALPRPASLARARSSTTNVSMAPDLSYISEASQEPSTGLSESFEESFTRYSFAGPDGIGMEQEHAYVSYPCERANLSTSLRSSIAEDQEVEDQLLNRASPSVSREYSPMDRLDHPTSYSHRLSEDFNKTIVSSTSTTQLVSTHTDALSVQWRPGGQSTDLLAPSRETVKRSPLSVFDECPAQSQEYSFGKIRKQASSVLRGATSVENLSSKVAKPAGQAELRKRKSEPSLPKRSIIVLAESARKPVGHITQPSLGNQKPALVRSMQPRPSDAALTSLTGAIASGHNKHEEQPKSVIAAAAPAGVTARRKSIKNSNMIKTLGASPRGMMPTALEELTSTDSSYTCRSRSTTPEIEPPTNVPTVLTSVSPILVSENSTTAVTQLSSTDRNARKDRLDVPVRTSTVVEQIPLSTAPRLRQNSNDTPSMPADGARADMSAEAERSFASGANARESRRSRASVNYQEPSLAKKLRQPAGYVPSIKTLASTRHQGSVGGGVRRKSSLQIPGRSTAQQDSTGHSGSDVSSDSD